MVNIYVCPRCTQVYHNGKPTFCQSCGCVSFCEYDNQAEVDELFRFAREYREQEKDYDMCGIAFIMTMIGSAIVFGIADLIIWLFF